VEVAAQRLLQKAEPMLKQRIAQMEIPTQSSPAGPSISGDEVRGIFEGLLALGRQTKTFSLGFDLDTGPFRVTSETQAVPGTDLAALFSSGASTARLKKLATGHQIQLKTHAYDIDRAVGMLSDLFGPLYQQLGIDIAGLAGIAGHFTGETVGGFSYGADGVQLEMIAVLDGTAAKSDFIEKVYLPWMEDYGRQMTASMSNLYGTSVPQIYQRTEDSTVAGVRVAGAIFRQAFPTTEAGSAGPMATIATKIRIAQIEDLILFAPDDNRMASLINAAKNMNTKRTEPGPHIRFEVDLAAYFRGLMAMLPELEGEAIRLPQTARLETTLTLAGGRAVSQLTMRGAGIADLAAAAQAAKTTGPAMAGAGRKSTPARLEMGPESAAAAPPPLPPEQDPDHWYEKGALAATYGADKWAIKYFEKVVALDPQRSDAWFEMGVSYGELRWFDKAVEAIDKAIALKPDSGLYYYGRGRIYLLLGADSRALADFQRAADLGSEDAREYLQDQKAGAAS
jgi:tetratricopeptide (TPR) repeat protein